MKNYLRRLTAGCLAVLLLPVNVFAVGSEGSRVEEPIPKGLLAEPVPLLLEEGMGAVAVQSADGAEAAAGNAVPSGNEAYFIEQMKQWEMQENEDKALQELLNRVNKGETDFGYEITEDAVVEPAAPKPDEKVDINKVQAPVVKEEVINNNPLVENKVENAPPVENVPGTGEGNKDNQTEGDKQDAPAEGDKQEDPAEGDKQDAPAEGDKQDAPAEGDKQEDPAEGDKQEDPAEGDKQEDPAEGDKQEDPAEGNKQEDPAEGDKQEDPAEGDKQEDPAEGDKQDAPAEGDKQEDPAEGDKQDAPAEDSKQDNQPESGETTKPEPPAESANPNTGTDLSGDSKSDSLTDIISESKLAYLRSDIENDTTNNYVFANGIPITIEDDAGTTKVKWGVNNELAVDGNTWIFGGSKTDNISTSTNITFKSGTVKKIYGGGLTGSVPGTNVTISGGTADYVYGGGASGDVTGATNVTMSSGKINNTIYGGGGDSNADVSSANVTIIDGTVSHVYCGGNDGVIGDTYLLIKGGDMKWAYGGGFKGTVSGTAKVDFFGGTVENNLYGGGDTCSVNATDVTVKGGTITVKREDSKYLGGIMGGGAYASAGTTKLTILSDVNFACGGGQGTTALAGNINVNLENGNVSTLCGGNYKGSQSGEKVNVNVSGSSYTSIGSADQLVCGDRETGSTSDVTFKMTGGRVAKLFPGYCNENNLSCTVDGGNVLENKTGAKLKNTGGKSLYGVLLATISGEDADYDLGGEKDICVSVGSDTWYSKLGEGGILKLHLPESSSIAANSIVVEVPGHKTYKNTTATVLPNDGNAIGLGGETNNTVYVNFGAKVKGSGTVRSGSMLEYEDQPVTSGSNVVFNAQPASGYRLVGWTINDKPVVNGADGNILLSNDDATLTVNSISKSLKIRAEFVLNGTVTFGGAPLANCTVKAVCGASTAKSTDIALGQLSEVETGKVVTFTVATKATGCEFVSWRMDGKRVSSNEDGFTWKADGTAPKIEAEYVKKSELSDLLAKAEPIKTTGASEASGAIYYATPTQESEFNTAYTNANNAVNATYTIPSADVPEVAQTAIDNAKSALENTMGLIKNKISINTSTGGSVTTSSEKSGYGKYTTAGGEKITVTVTPDAGYQLKAGTLKYEYSKVGADTNPQSVDITATDSVYSFTMPDWGAPVTIKAEFEPVGTAKVIYTTEDGTAASATAKGTLKVTSTVASHSTNTVEVADAKGNITNVKVTDTITFEATAVRSNTAPSYSVDKWEITPSDGATMETEDTTDVNGITKSVCTLTNVSKNVEVKVFFKQNQHKITFTSTDGKPGKITKVGGDGVQQDSENSNLYVGLAGSTVQLKVKPNTGYVPVVKYTKTVNAQPTTDTLTSDNDADNDGVYICTFTMPDEDTTITAEFTEKSSTVECEVEAAAANGTLEAQKEDGTKYTINAGKYGVNFGEKVYIKANPDDGYKLKASNPTIEKEDGSAATVTLTLETDGRYSFTMPEYSVKVKAGFELAEYAITTTPPPADDGETVPGEVEITKVEVKDGGSIAAPTAPTAPAKWEKAHYTNKVTVTVTPFALKTGGGTEAPTASATADYVLDTITYTDADGKDVPLTKSTEAGADNQYWFEMPNYPVAVKANFKRLYKITNDTKVEGGALDANVKITAKVKDQKTQAESTQVMTSTDTVIKVKNGDYIVFTTESAGKTPDGLNIRDASGTAVLPEPIKDVDNRFQWTMQAKDVKIEATFKNNPFQIEVPDHGASDSYITVEPGEMEYTGTGDVKITSYPQKGYELDKLTVTSTPPGTPSTPTTEDVVVGGTDNGAITNKTLVSTGKNEKGYETYKFKIKSMPSNDITVTPVFKLKTYKVTSVVKPEGGTPAAGTVGIAVAAKTSGTSGTTAPADTTNGDAYYDNEVTVTVTADAAKQLKSLSWSYYETTETPSEAGSDEPPTLTTKTEPTKKTVDLTDGTINKSAWNSTKWDDKYEFKFDMPTSDVKVEAEFEDRMYTITPKVTLDGTATTDWRDYLTFSGDANASVADIGKSDPVKIPASSITAATKVVEMKLKDGTKYEYSSTNPNGNISGTDSSPVSVSITRTTTALPWSIAMPKANIIVNVALVTPGKTDDGSDRPAESTTPVSVQSTTSSHSTSGTGTGTNTGTNTSTNNATLTTVSKDNVTAAITNATPAEGSGNNVQLVIAADRPEGNTSDVAVFSLPKDTVTAIVDAMNASGAGEKKVDSIKLETPSGATASFNSEAVAAIASAYSDTENSSVEITIQPATSEQTSAFVAQGDSGLADTIYSFEVKIDGKTVGSSASGGFGEGGKVTLSIPYTPVEGEDTTKIKACYIDMTNRDNPYQEIADSQYSDGMVTFTTTHFSLYGVMYHENPFTDITGHWAEDAIAAMELKGLVNGVTETEFMPDMMLKRCMLVTMLGRMADAETEDVKDTGFADVPADAYYAPYMAWAKGSGIAQGTGNGMFSPETPITREQLAVLLYRYAALKYENAPKAASSELFSDDEAISPWAKEAVYALRDADIINGMGDNSYNPRDNATRAQVCTVIQRMLDRFENETVLA